MTKYFVYFLNVKRGYWLEISPYDGLGWNFPHDEYAARTYQEHGLTLTIL